MNTYWVLSMSQTLIDSGHMKNKIDVDLVFRVLMVHLRNGQETNTGMPYFIALHFIVLHR